MGFGGEERGRGGGVVMGFERGGGVVMGFGVGEEGEVN